MSLIQGSEVTELIKLFNSRGVKFYHACQYKDFKTYLQLGGVPSRNLMEASGLPYTFFETDEVDKTNEVWDKVFGNLSDFGISFSQGKKNENTAPTPNPYGPVLLIFNPDVFYEATDLAICLRSAGGKNFSRDTESLSSAIEVNRIFQYRIEDAPNNYAKAYIKFSKGLREEFNNHQAMSPEVSFKVQSEKISFNYLTRVVVDSYTISGQNLSDKVRKLKQLSNLPCFVQDRRYGEGRREIKQELADLLLQQDLTINEIIQNRQTSENLKDWGDRLIKGGMIWQYNRFAKYLRLGTILEIHREAF